MSASAQTRPPVRGLRQPVFDVERNFVERVIKHIQVVDIRNEAEDRADRIPGSLAVRVGDLYEWVFTRNRDLPLILVCEDGTLSGELCATLATFGFPNVVRLKGGIRAWRVG